MKKVLVVIALLAVTTVYAAVVGLWKSDKAHSQLQFTVVHMGISDISGTFNDFQATIESSKEDFSDAKVTLNANVGSINTRVDARDNHLKSADFFDAEKYPEITFKSTALEKTGENTYKLTGDLTMHGVTKAVTMDWKFRGKLDQGEKGATAGFQLSGIIKRSDFNIGAKFPEAVISDEVRIKADGEFKDK